MASHSSNDKDLNDEKVEKTKELEELKIARHEMNKDSQGSCESLDGDNSMDLKGAGASQNFQNNGEDIHKRAIRFLNHPKVGKLPWATKESYLRSKGLSDQDVVEVKAMIEASVTESGEADTIWQYSSNREARPGAKLHDSQLADQNHHHQSNNPPHQSHPNPHMGLYSNPTRPPQELPNPMVPITLGGFLSIIGLAALRWLNGGDFVLFPPPVQVQTSSNMDDDVKTDLPDAIGEQNQQMDPAHLQVNGEEDSSDIDDGDSEWDGVPDQDFEDLKRRNALTCEIQNLTQAIERGSILKERVLKIQSEGVAKNMTNDVMHLLRNGDENKNSSTKNEIEEQGKEGRILSDSSSLAILIQLTEFKCAIQSLTNHVSIGTHIEDNKADEIINKLDEILPYLRSIESCVLGKGSKCNMEIIQKDGNDAWPSESIDSSFNDGLKSSNQTRALNPPPDTCSQMKQNDNEREDNDITRVESNSKGDVFGSKALSDALRQFEISNSKDRIKSCSQMMYLYTMNLSLNPLLSKYKKIYTNNNTYKNTIGEAKFASDILHAIGFVDKGSYLEWEGDEIITEHNNSNSSHDDGCEEVLDAIGLVKDAMDALNTLKSV
jgi:hypothetical protein